MTKHGGGHFSTRAFVSLWWIFVGVCSLFKMYDAVKRLYCQGVIDSGMKVARARRGLQPHYCSGLCTDPCCTFFLLYVPTLNPQVWAWDTWELPRKKVHFGKVWGCVKLVLMCKSRAVPLLYRLCSDILIKQTQLHCLLPWSTLLSASPQTLRLKIHLVSKQTKTMTEKLTSKLPHDYNLQYL